jgi:hypothetical protein
VAVVAAAQQLLEQLKLLVVVGMLLVVDTKYVLFEEAKLEVEPSKDSVQDYSCQQCERFIKFPE